VRASDLIAAALPVLAACAPRPSIHVPAPDELRADTVALAALARELSADAMRGRGAWTPENAAAARQLAGELARLGARPVLDDAILVPFTAERRPDDTVHNVIAVLPARDGTVAGTVIGLTAHFDGLGVGAPDSSGDSIYNGFLDAAVPTAIVLDVARRYALAPGDRPLAVMLFNLEEQGLLGSRAFAARDDAAPLLNALELLIGVDAGSPAGVATVWQLMGSDPPHAGAVLADSLARARGWTTTASAPRPISDVFVFSQRGVPILFPIPGATWAGYAEAERAEAMRRFDHYHRPADEWRAEFPWAGTAAYADWLWDIVRHAADTRRTLR
jgi:Zn-dependent M28 family amino/carboxypeptidase